MFSLLFVASFFVLAQSDPIVIQKVDAWIQDNNGKRAFVNITCSDGLFSRKFMIFCLYNLVIYNN